MKSLLLPALLVTSTLAGDGVRFEPRFVVLTATNDPAPQYRWADLGRSARERYNALTWQTKPVKKVAKKAAKQEHVADGFDPAADLAKDEGRTFDIFQSGALEAVNGSSDWKFPENSRFSLHATLGRGEDPLLMFTFTPKQDGWYSIGYVGAPEVEPAALDEMWQPLVWQEKRFPLYPYLTEASRCTLPGTLVAQGGVTRDGVRSLFLYK